MNNNIQPNICKFNTMAFIKDICITTLAQSFFISFNNNNKICSSERKKNVHTSGTGLHSISNGRTKPSAGENMFVRVNLFVFDINGLLYLFFFIAIDYLERPYNYMRARAYIHSRVKQKTKRKKRVKRDYLNMGCFFYEKLHGDRFCLFNKCWHMKWTMWAVPTPKIIHDANVFICILWTFSAIWYIYST